MAKSHSITQPERVLNLYHHLITDEYVNKQQYVLEYDINVRTFARDMVCIRQFLCAQDTYSEVKYDSKKGYSLSGYTKTKFSTEDMIVTLRMLINSRAFSKKYLDQLVELIIQSSPVYDQNSMRNIFKNELMYYVPLENINPNLFETIWQLEKLILKKSKITMNYTKANLETITTTVIPVSVMFSEYYFYIIAYADDDKYERPISFRIDRIIDFESADKCKATYLYEQSRICELKNKLQFMQGGEKLTITFKFWGKSLQAILDKFPNSEVIGYDGDKAIVKAHVLSKSAKMWLLSQAQYLEILSPEEFREDMKNTIEQMLDNYK
ncbi:MAG: hypothetical protein ATN35_02610 [Epulopiscium sp. Nele67-Bin004]|nr:MAG: hypothetical protein ATN35_02610 [Epulopiscium sp. Nele67-Bin004]